MSDRSRHQRQELSWSNVGPRILPLFERVRPYLPGSEPRLKTLVPPGVTISLGIDIGPAFVHIGEELLEEWSMTLADLTAQALANLHQRASEIDPAKLHHDTVGGVPVALLQTGLSIGSVLVLAPTELRRLFGRSRDCSWRQCGI